MNFYEQIFSRGRATGEGMTHFERLFAAKFGGSPPPEVREYTGAVPVTITADGTPLIDYLITGNTTQSGTPTPENPIMPQGTGERTGNLFDAATAYGAMYSGGVITGQANAINETKNKATTDMIGKTYTISITPLQIASRAYMAITINGTTYWRENELTVNQRSSFQFTPVTENDQWFITYNIGNVCSYKDIMVNEGSTPLPYEPYGYKLDISSASTTTPVYLGEVETTRKIKKLVFDGTENWYSNHLSENLFNLGIVGYVKSTNTTICLCTHYKAQQNIVLWTNVQDKSVCFFDTASNLFYLRDSDFSTVADFKSYLQQQYAAGTPVTVWYVLATEQTGIVNEPLMRIGDYADTLSYAQAGVTIPTNNGSTTVDVDTTVKPSEVYLKYMG